MKIIIRSFSYKQGYPQETSEHGGGFIFDCRAISNPGKMVEYQTLSGLDKKTAEWLTKNTWCSTFLSEITIIIARHLAVYHERNFDEIIISFGCTGGQHRSVFMAEKLKDYLSGYASVEIEIVHTEKDRWPIEASRERQW